MTTAAEHKERQRLQWSEAAESWNALYEWYTGTFGPVIAWSVDAAELAPGMKLLDIGCGCGQPALTAAPRVGPSGAVVGIDISGEMLVHAARRAEANGLHQVSFREMDAERLEFEGDSFDAVTCSCALMFFPDPVGALKEMHRVLKSGGRLVVGVWDEPARNSFVTLGGQSVAEFFPAPAGPPDPMAPNAFRFARPGSLETTIGDAGFRDIHIDRRTVGIDFASPDEYWGIFSQMAAGARQKVLQMSESNRARLRALVNDSARAHEIDGRLRLTATLQCASARK